MNKPKRKPEVDEVKPFDSSDEDFDENSIKELEEEFNSLDPSTIDEGEQ